MGQALLFLFNFKRRTNMYILYSPKTGTIHPETQNPYLGIASVIYTGFLEYLQEMEQAQEN